MKKNLLIISLLIITLSSLVYADVIQFNGSGAGYQAIRGGIGLLAPNNTMQRQAQLIIIPGNSMIHFDSISLRVRATGTTGSVISQVWIAANDTNLPSTTVAYENANTSFSTATIPTTCAQGQVFNYTFANLTDYNSSVGYFFILAGNEPNTAGQFVWCNQSSYTGVGKIVATEEEGATSWSGSLYGAGSGQNGGMDFTLYYHNVTSANPSIVFQGQTPANNSVVYYQANYTINTTTTYLNGQVNTTHYLYNKTGSLIIQNNITNANATSIFTFQVPGYYYYNASATNGTNTTKTDIRNITAYSLTAPLINFVNTTTRNDSINLTWPDSLYPTNITTTNYILKIFDTTTYLRTIINVTNSTTYLLNLTAQNLTTGKYYFQLDVHTNTTYIQGNNISIDYPAPAIIYNSPAVELITYDFILNFTGGTISNTSLNGTLWYNGTGYNASWINASNFFYLISNVTIAQLNMTRTNQFYFNYTINGINLVTSTYNQTIVTAIPITIVNGNCGAGLSTAMFFNIKDEETLTNLNNTVQYNLVFYYNDPSVMYTAFGSITTTQNFSICMNSTQFPYWTINNSDIRYSNNSYNEHRYYIFQNTRLTNQTVNITLYNLKTTSQTSFTLTAQSNTLDTYENKYTALIRWYPGDNAYRIVDMGLTDNQGSTVIHVAPEDVDYRIGIYQLNGTLIYLASPIRMVCLSTPCSYTLTIPGTTTSYTNYLLVQTQLTYNATTGIWRFIWNDPSQTTSQMNLTVYKETGTTTFAVCNSYTSGYTGAITCNTSAYTGRMHAIVERSASPPLAIADLIIDVVTSPFTSTWGLFLSFLIITPIIFVFALISPIAGIIGAVASLIPAWYFGTISFTIIASLAVMGGIIIHFLNRSRGAR